MGLYSSLRKRCKKWWLHLSCNSSLLLSRKWLSQVIARPLVEYFTGILKNLERSLASCLAQCTIEFVSLPMLSQPILAVPQRHPGTCPFHADYSSAFLSWWQIRKLLLMSNLTPSLLQIQPTTVCPFCSACAKLSFLSFATILSADKEHYHIFPHLFFNTYL